MHHRNNPLFPHPHVYYSIVVNSNIMFLNTLFQEFRHCKYFQTMIYIILGQITYLINMLVGLK